MADRYAFVDCADSKGNEWCHYVSDPDETVRQISADMPDVIARVRETRSEGRDRAAGQASIFDVIGKEASDAT